MCKMYKLEPCGCVEMENAMGDGQIVVSTIHHEGARSLVFALSTFPLGGHVVLHSITYCPWCGNAAYKIVDGGLTRASRAAQREEASKEGRDG